MGLDPPHACRTGMEFIGHSSSAFHPLCYPDTPRVGSGTRLRGVSVPGFLGPAWYYVQAADNVGEQSLLYPDDSLALFWMDPAEQLLENYFPRCQPSAQYAHHTTPYLSFLPDPLSHASPFPSQWDTAAISHLDLPSAADDHYAYQSADAAENPYSLHPNASAVGSCSWDEEMPLGLPEQVAFAANDSRTISASAPFTDGNDFAAGPVHSPTLSYDGDGMEPSCYPTPPLSPQYFLYDRDCISLPTHDSPSKSAADRWKCPHCNYIQARRRMVDLKRHIATHNKPSDVALWTCCGFPRELARAKGVPDDVIRETSVIHGRVGGCWETFSRRDALQRHLRKQKGRCFGDAYADWHLGNSNKRDRLAKSKVSIENTWEAYES